MPLNFFLLLDLGITLVNVMLAQVKTKKIIMKLQVSPRFFFLKAVMKVLKGKI